jgi:hypothetical protein
VTRFQQLLGALGFWRFKRYRRWVGGRWVERYIEPTPHSSELPRWRWELDPGAKFNDYVHAIEQWPTKLPIARVMESK